MNGYWELKVRDSFSAAHALRAYKGKCENTHGHNFQVEVCARGSNLLPGTEFLIDFGILKHCLAIILAKLDHRDLNSTAPFDSINPTSENIARYIYEQMLMELAACPEAAQVQLARVEVAENSNQSAAWIVAS